MNESLLHTAFRYNDFALVERLSKRLDYRQNLLANNSEGETCVEIAFAMEGCLGFLPPDIAIPIILNSPATKDSKLLKFLKSGDRESCWNSLAQTCDKSLLEEMIEVASRKGLYRNIPHALLLQFKKQHHYAALQLIESGKLDSLPPELSRLDLWMQNNEFDSLYHAAARNRILHVIPANLLTEESLLLRGSDGKTPIHLLASKGPGTAIEELFRRVTWPINMQEADMLGNTVVHEAASAGLLAFLPPDSMTDATMSIKRNDGLTPVDLAFKHKYINTVPERFRFMGFLYTRHRLEESAKSGHWSWIGNQQERVEFALGEICKISHGGNFLHISSSCRKLHSVPEFLIRKELLGMPDVDGNTPLHLAAANGHIHLVLRRNVDQELLKKTNRNGKNVIDICFQRGYIKSIAFGLRFISSEYSGYYLSETIKGEAPLDLAWIDCDDLLCSPKPYSEHETFAHWMAAEGLLKSLPDNFLQVVARARPDANGETPLHAAAANGHLGAVPESLLGHQQLLTKDSRGMTVIDLCFESGGISDLDPALRRLSPLYRRSNLARLISKGVQPEEFHFENADLLESPHPASNHHSFAHWLADEGLLLKYFPGIIDTSVLVVADSNGTTPLHLLAAKPEIHDFPISVLSDSLLAVRDKDGTTPFHVAAFRGTLHLLPPEVLKEDSLRVFDNKGRSPLHYAAEAGNLAQLPDVVFSLLGLPDGEGRTSSHIAAASGQLGSIPPQFISPSILSIADNDGETSFHLASRRPDFDGIPISWFTREILLTKNHSGRSVSDIIEEHDTTALLPPHLRNFSKARALARLSDCFSQDFAAAAELHARALAEAMPLEEFQTMRMKFVQEWSKQYPDLELDEEQAEAVAEYGPHIQVTARAGSGKTRTLVARALFQITHCRIPASSILILAFNKKAVAVIRERLGKRLSEEQMPHVLTFHALAHRIVKPSEDLIFDEGETKESQVFSTTIQRIIDDEMRGGPFEAKLRELMEARWKANLNWIIALGFNLPQEEFLAHRTNLPETTMNGRRVDTEAHKHIGNALLRLGLGYSYRRAIHRAAGTAYAPDFSHYHKETDQWFLIEVLGETGTQTNAARQAFLNSDRSANAHLVRFTEADCQDPDATLERVARELSSRGITTSPMNDDELWLLLRDDVIRDFTKAVRGFISRCQKELISPDRLEGMLPDTDPELWRLRVIGYNQYIKVPTVDGLQVRFWRLCSEIYRCYRKVLAESHQTDFDQLMLDAATMIREGRTGFNSARGSGDIRQVRHLLIDEYQDFSHLFDELRKSIIVQSPDANFFCVGDDWQAINKFSGSDLRYFTGFTETFEPSVRKLITRNYRSCRRIVEIGNRVMLGEGEPSVPNSNEQGNTWRVEVGDYGNLSEAEEVLVEELGDDALSILRIASDCTSRGESVAILSRTSSVATPERMHKLERWQEKLRSFLPEKDRGLLEVSTTHGYKGKEADAVILLDPEAYPFVHPDSIFNTIFGDTFQSIQDDEKRLFYVGVTRPKKTLYLLSYPSRYSESWSYTIRFLADAYPPSFDLDRLQSNLLCGSRVVVRLKNRPGTYGNGGTFPIKDQLKESEFKWNEDRKIWSIFLERGSISSPFECVQYLNAQPWIKNADGIVASFAWEDQKHQFRIDRGQVIPDTAAAAGPENPVIVGGQWQPIARRASPGSIQSKPQPAQQKPVIIGGQWQPLSRPTSTNTVVSSSHASPPKRFDTSVAGMRYEGRMEKAKHLKAEDDLILAREPYNPYDRNAIAVETKEGVQIGYLSRHVAAHLAKVFDAHGGKWSAKVSSVWKQPSPHFLVSIQLSFMLPQGVSIPAELDSSTQATDSPFDSPRPPIAPPAQTQVAPEPHSPQPPKAPAVFPQTPAAAQTPVVSPQPPPPVSGSLTPAQENELADLGEPRLRSIITELYLSGTCPWPVIGYEGQDAKGRCTDSMLEVAWPDQKIGIYLPTNNVSSFSTTGWVILPAAAVSIEMLRSILSSSTGQAASPQSPTSPPTQSPGQSPPETIDDDDIPF